MRTIVLISGWAGSGKDTVADYLAFRYGFQRIAFGYYLKRDVAKETGIPLATFYNRALKDTVVPEGSLTTLRQTPRDLLLHHARKARAVDPDVYAKQAINEINELPLDQDIVISDWRYKRELQFMKTALESNSIIRTIRIERPGLITINDETEHDLDSSCFDHVLENSGTIEILYSKVLDLQTVFNSSTPIP